MWHVQKFFQGAFIVFVLELPAETLSDDFRQCLCSLQARSCVHSSGFAGPYIALSAYSRILSVWSQSVNDL